MSGSDGFLFVSCFGCFVCVPLNRGAEVMFLVVCGKMTIQRNDDVRTRRLFSRQTLQAWSQKVDQRLRNDFVDIAVSELSTGIADHDVEMISYV